jgi:hypothetical protein
VCVCVCVTLSDEVPRQASSITYEAAGVP